MRRPCSVRSATVALAATACVMGAAAAPASGNLCSVAGVVNGAAGKVCTVVTRGGKLLAAGKKLVTGHVGGAVHTIIGGGGSGGGASGGGGGGSTATTAIGLAAIGAWVIGGADIALHETAKVLGQTTSPQLRSTWFSSAYWRMAAIAALLTLPFLFAAAVQAILHSDLALLARAALGYLPLSLLAVSIAAPLTMLLLAASDELSSIVSSAAGDAGVRFLDRAGIAIGALTILSGSPFLAFLVGLFTAAGALVLWLELLMREAAVYVIVLMLPLVFAALVWPARRVWARRAVELLVALILSKFAIVAVLALGGAALSQGGHGVTGSLAGVVLLLMGAFAPWALLRLVPLAELASGAVSSLRAEGRAMRGPAMAADASARWAHGRWGDDWAAGLTAGMRRQADETADAGAARNGAHGTADEAHDVAEPDGVMGSGAIEANAGGGETERADGAGVADDRGSAASPTAAAAGAGGSSTGGGASARSADHASAARDIDDASGGTATSPDPAQPLDEESPPIRLDAEGWPPAPIARPWSDDPADGADRNDSPGSEATGDEQEPRPPAQEPDEGRL